MEIPFPNIVNITSRAGGVSLQELKGQLEKEDATAVKRQGILPGIVKTSEWKDQGDNHGGTVEIETRRMVIGRMMVENREENTENHGTISRVGTRQK